MAEYLTQFDALAQRVTPESGIGVLASYRAALTKAHARKPAVWPACARSTEEPT